MLRIVTKEKQDVGRRRRKSGDKEKKGVFKVSLYKPQPLGYLPSNTTAHSRGKVSG